MASCRDCDSDKVKQAVENKGRHGHHKLSKRRSVNFVIFVVNALSVHKMYLTPQDGDHTPRDNLRRLFKFPFMSFNGNHFLQMIISWIECILLFSKTCSKPHFHVMRRQMDFNLSGNCEGHSPISNLECRCQACGSDDTWGFAEK